MMNQIGIVISIIIAVTIVVVVVGYNCLFAGCFLYFVLELFATDAHRLLDYFLILFILIMKSFLCAAVAITTTAVVAIEGVIISLSLSLLRLVIINNDR